MDAFGYVRVSTKEQNDSGFGLDVQRTEIEQYALGHGLRITEWFSDDISGDTHSRPALDRMQAALNQGRNRTVIIHRPDRLARKSWIAEMLMDQWHSRGINIHFQNHGYIENTPEARFQIGIFCQHGELDKRLLLRKLNGARRNKATQHQMPVGNGTAPFGLLFKGRRKDQTVETVPEDAETIKQIFDWFVNRGMQIQAIADELTRLGIPTASDRYPERFGKKSIRGRGEWNPQVIYNMLRHPAYMGRMPHFRKVQTITEVVIGRV